MERSKKDRVPYDAWEREGWLVATPGNVVDYEFPKAALRDFAKVYTIEEVAYDPWNATQTATDLQQDGLTCVEFRQGFASMSEPSKEFEKIVVSKQCGHRTAKGINPVMRWMLSNVAVKRDPADNIKPDKSRAVGRIDGVVASIMALGRGMVAAPADTGPWLVGAF
jgi:phage terminase large subunit-like protein